MRLKHLFAMALFFVLVLSFCPSTHAYLQKVNFHVWTTNYTDHTELNVWLEAFHCTSKNPPDFVKSITITAPDGTVFNMDPVDDWLPYDRGYYSKYLAENFTSQQIPAGNYTVRIEGFEHGIVISDSDDNDASTLALPVFETLPEDLQSVPKDFIFWWHTVEGATYYRVLLWNESWNEPVYWFWDKQFRTNLRACKFPNGELKPNTDYKMRIEARSGSQDLDKRSRTDWLYFTTGNW